MAAWSAVAKPTIHTPGPEQFVNFWDPLVQSSNNFGFSSVQFSSLSQNCFGKFVQFSSIRYRKCHMFSSFSSKFTQFSSVQRSVQVGDHALLTKPRLAYCKRSCERFVGGSFWSSLQLFETSGGAIRRLLSRKFRAAGLGVVTLVEVWDTGVSGCACLLFQGGVWRRGEVNSVQND